MRIRFYLLSIHVDNVTATKASSNNEKENKTIKYMAIKFEDSHLYRRNRKLTHLRKHNNDDKLFTPQKIH